MPVTVLHHPATLVAEIRPHLEELTARLARGEFAACEVRARLEAPGAKRTTVLLDAEEHQALQRAARARALSVRLAWLVLGLAVTSGAAKVSVPPHTISTAAAAVRLGVSAQTIRRWIAEGVLRGVRAPGARSWRVESASLVNAPPP